MPHPWFVILCPACGEFWGERGRVPAEGFRSETLVTPCLRCEKDISIEFAYDPSGKLAIESVIDYETMEEGDWSPLLDDRVHWREVN
ncbi:hypothetical protein FBQ97_00055 [Acidobacteria bacterium ACD]|nr:MAG: hypothetical protein EDX89_05515 [Acidobacteriota bacterium]MCE7956473.1 hypothetical protein [Acidobacteria bacterium ACB2]MDL1948197.1 hypothetical protein [Acidobacteria bacterium ACD]